jgi:glutaredoxin
MPTKTLLVLALCFAGWKMYGHRQEKIETANAVRYQAELVQLETKRGVTLFTATWCGYCAKLKERLTASKVPYVEYDIEASPQGKMYYAKSDFEGVPIIVVDGNTIQGYDMNKMPRAFADAGFNVTGL